MRVLASLGYVRELGEGITTEELVAMEDRLKTRALPQLDIDVYDEDDYDELLEAFDDPTFELYSLLMVQAWGRKTDAGSVGG
jgi:hypothetical protein